VSAVERLAVTPFAQMGEQLLQVAKPLALARLRHWIDARHCPSHGTGRATASRGKRSGQAQQLGLTTLDLAPHCDLSLCPQLHYTPRSCVDRA